MPVKRWEKVCAALGVLLIAAGMLSERLPANLLFGRLPADSRREILIENATARAADDVCQVPTTVLRVPPWQKPLGAGVVFHGLAANRRLMTLLGESLANGGLTAYLIDLPGHGDNTDPFSFARAEECAAAVVEHLIGRGEITLDRTVLVGHSLGGDIAMRLADRFTARATIAISPGPLVSVPGIPDHLHIYDMPKRAPDTLLILAGGFDVPGFAYGAREMMRQFGGELTPSSAGYRRGHPRKLTMVDATHTSLVFHHQVLLWSSEWARRALGEPNSPLGRSPLRWLQVQAAPLGVVLLFPGLVTLLTLISWSAAGAQGAEQEPLAFSRTAAIWAAGGVLAVLAVAAADPLAFLGLYTGSYLTSCVLVVGLISFAGIRRASLPVPTVSFGAASRVPPPSGDCKRYAIHLFSRMPASRLVIGGGMALYLVLAFGWAFSQSLGDLRMNAERWWRFLALIPFMLPYSVAEELVVGGPWRSWRHKKNESCRAEGCREHEPAGRRWLGATGRLLRWLTLRFLLWAPMVAAIFVLGSEHILAAVMAPSFLVVSLGQRLGADVIRRRSGSFLAGAIFSAILAAWFIAAVFPMV